MNQLSTAPVTLLTKPEPFATDDGYRSVDAGHLFCVMGRTGFEPVALGLKGPCSAGLS